jgi:hypothetical protein
VYQSCNDFLSHGHQDKNVYVNALHFITSGDRQRSLKVKKTESFREPEKYILLFNPDYGSVSMILFPFFNNITVFFS